MTADTSNEGDDADNSSAIATSSVGSSPVLVGRIGNARNAAANLSSSMTLPPRAQQLLSMENWKADGRDKKLNELLAQLGFIDHEVRSCVTNVL